MLALEQQQQTVLAKFDIQPGCEGCAVMPEVCELFPAASISHKCGQYVKNRVKLKCSCTELH